MKKKKAFSKKTALLLAAAAVLLAGSGIGSARAALTYYSDNYTAQIDMSEIGVTLNEKGDGDDEAKAVSYRNYEGDAWNASGEGTLLSFMDAEGFKVTPGKKYTEEISATNSGDIDSYVRITITKSWQKPVTDADGNVVTDAEGNAEYEKDTTLDPSWIDLNILSDGWIAGESTAEKAVYYYTDLLEPGETTKALSDTIRINSKIAASMTQIKNADGSITYEYDYDGYKFILEAEVDAVQTHNATDAIKSAWGVDVTMSGDTITSVTE